MLLCRSTSDAFYSYEKLTGKLVVIPSFAGAVRDVTGSFDSLFLMCGAPVLLAGILLLFHPLAKKLEHRLHGHKEDETDGEVKLEHGAYRHTDCDHDREVKAEEQAHGNHITSQDD